MSTTAPRTPIASPRAPAEIRRVARAARAKRAAEREYLDALCAARAAGHSAAAIGDAAGVSRQAVLKMTTPAE